MTADQQRTTVSMSWQKKGLFTILLLAILFGVLELGVRGYRRITRKNDPNSQPKIITNRGTLYQSHPFLTYALNPDKPEYTEQGLRDSRIFETTFEGIRIACLGGSSTYGTHVRPPDSYPAQLEKRLNDSDSGAFQVINSGVPGYTTFNLTGLLSFRLLDLDPDICIFYTGFNDAWNRFYFADYKSDDTHAAKAWKWRDLSPPWWRSVAIFDAVANATGHVQERAPHIHKICWREQSGTPARNWDNSSSSAFRRNLTTLISICRGHGIVPVFCTQATDFSNYPVKGMEDVWPQAMVEATAVLRDVAAKREIHLIDLAEQMDNKKEYFDDCLHMTEEGNRVRAEIIARYLQENGMLDAKPTSPSRKHPGSTAD